MEEAVVTITPVTTPLSSAKVDVPGTIPVTVLGTTVTIMWVFPESSVDVEVPAVEPVVKVGSDGAEVWVTMTPVTTPSSFVTLDVPGVSPLAVVGITVTTTRELPSPSSMVVVPGIGPVVTTSGFTDDVTVTITAVTSP
jgi:hypothetical protein